MNPKILPAVPCFLLVLVRCVSPDGSVVTEPVEKPNPIVVHKPIADFSPMNGHDYEYEYEYSAPFGAPGFYACNLLLSARRVAASDTDTTYSVAENFTCVFRWSNVGDVDSTWSSRITAVVEKGGVNRYAPDSLNDPIKRVPFFRYNAIDTAELRAFEYGGRMWVSKSDRGEVRLDGGYGPGGYRALYVRGIGLVDWYDHHKNGYNTGGGGWRSYRLRKFDGVIIDSDSLVAISDSR